MRQHIKHFIIIAVLLVFAAPLVVYAVKIPDPLNVKDPLEIFARVIQGFLGIIGVWALLNFIIAGLGIIQSQGSSEKLQKHKENLVWTTIGIGLLLGAYAIIGYVIDRLAGATIIQ